MKCANLHSKFLTLSLVLSTYASTMHGSELKVLPELLQKLVQDKESVLLISTISTSLEYKQAFRQAIQEMEWKSRNGHLDISPIENVVRQNLLFAQRHPYLFAYLISCGVVPVTVFATLYALVLGWY